MKSLKRVYKLFCRVDTQGDEDGVSKPISQLASPNKKSFSKTPLPRMKFSAYEFPGSTKEMHSDHDERHTSPSSLDIDKEKGSKRKVSYVPSIENANGEEINQKDQKEIKEIPIEREDIIIENGNGFLYGETLLNKENISKLDIIEVFN